MSVLTTNASHGVKILIISLNKNIPRILENILFSGFSISRKILSYRKKQTQKIMHTVKCTYDNNSSFTNTVMNLWKIYKNVDYFIMFIP